MGRRGRSEQQLARAHVTRLFRRSLDERHGLSDPAPPRLWDGPTDLLVLDLSLLVAVRGGAHRTPGGLQIVA